jgi:hypothetical protein
VFPIDHSKFPFWYLVDLHSHTVNGIDFKKNHCVDKDYSPTAFFNYVQTQGVSLKAVTNHNTFLLVDHIKQALICALLGVTYIPGIELDCLFASSQRFQMIILFDPSQDLIPLATKVAEHVDEAVAQRKRSELYYNFDDFCHLFSNLSYILVPHAKKANGLISNLHYLSQADIDNNHWVIDAIQNSFARPILFDSSSEEQIYVVASALKRLTENPRVQILFENGIVCSDYTFDGDTSRAAKTTNEPGFCIQAKPTYRGLEIAIRNYKTRFRAEDKLLYINKYIKSLRFVGRDDSVFHVDGEIALSPQLNVIIGDSGSGKTLLLNELYKLYTGKNLSACVPDNRMDDPYKKKIGISGLLAPKDSQEIAQRIKAIEIPKIYDKILASVSNESSSDLFHLNPSNGPNSVLLSYINRLSRFEDLHNNLRNDQKEGVLRLDGIKTDIQFLAENKSGVVSFKLQTNAFNSSELDALKKKKEKIDKLIGNKNSIIDYFEDVRGLLGNEEKANIDAIEADYSGLISKLIDLGNKTALLILEQEITKKLFEHVGGAIDRVFDLLDSHASAINKKRKEKENLDNELTQSLVSCLAIFKEKEALDCAFPFEELKADIEKNNNSTFARISTGYLDKDISGDFLEESSIVNPENRKTKLRDAGKYDFTNSKRTKEIAENLLDQDSFRLSTAINQLPKLITEIKPIKESSWRNIRDVNPGDIVKTYMNYYFTDLITKDVPDVIFIDQPENDVDKSFITNILSAFIREHKTMKQFIITSHDPILTVNSDANLIINAYRDEKNRICYRAFNMEDVDEKSRSNIGTNTVSNILDGGAQNVVFRNLIYGGQEHEFGD